ncbi:MAG TPA: universal stress protein [Blastocatellia bacterium]|nr:universal stress protein [Blastocatellia bacterium]
MLLLPLKKILWPTDFSDCSYAALRNAVELAVQFDAELFLLHVIPPIPKPITAASTVGLEAAYEPYIAEYERGLHAGAEQKLREVIERNAPRGVKARPLVGRGDAAGEIARMAEDERVGLIVMATHGMTGWRNLELGSVAERVARLSTRPVLTIRVPSGTT